MSQHFSDDEKLYFEVAKIRARRKSRNNIVEQQRRKSTQSLHLTSHERYPAAHAPVANSHQSQHLQNNNENRHVDERLILSILQRIRAKRNGSDNVSSFSSYSAPTSIPPAKQVTKIITEKLYYTTEGTQTEELQLQTSQQSSLYSAQQQPQQQKIQQPVYQHDSQQFYLSQSKATPPSNGYIKKPEESVIVGVLENFDDEYLHHYITPPRHRPSNNNNNNNDNTLYSNNNNHSSKIQKPNFNHVEDRSSKTQMKNSSTPSTPLTYRKTSPQTNKPTPLSYTPSSSFSSSSSSISTFAKKSTPPNPRELFLPDEDVYFTSPQQSPKQVQTNSPPNVHPFSVADEDDEKMIELNDFRLTSDRIQQFRISMSPSENRLFKAEVQHLSAGTPIFVEWPPASPPIYKSGHSMTSLHHIPPVKHENIPPLPPSNPHSSQRTPPTSARDPQLPDAPSSVNLLSSQNNNNNNNYNYSNNSPPRQRPRTSDFTQSTPPRSRLPNYRHTLSFGTPTPDQNGIHTYDFYDYDDDSDSASTRSKNRNSLDGIYFMEDDEDEMNLNDSSLYDLSPSLTRARRHSLTQQNPSPIPIQPPLASTASSSSSSQNGKIQARKPPASTSGLQTITSGKAVSNIVNQPSSVSFARSDSSSALESTEAQDDILRPLIEGVGMLKVSRRAAPERRFFRVVVGQGDNTQVVWSKSADSKAVSSLNMRDVINIVVGVPSAKLLQSAKKISAVDLATRVFSIVTRQRTLEILADSTDQRQLWVDALAHIQKNQMSSIRYIKAQSPTISRASTPSSGRKSPFRFLRSKTPDF